MLLSTSRVQPNKPFVAAKVDLSLSLSLIWQIGMQTDVAAADDDGSKLNFCSGQKFGRTAADGRTPFQILPIKNFFGENRVSASEAKNMFRPLRAK